VNLPHAKLIGRFEGRSAFAADYRAAITARERIGDLGRAFGAVETLSGVGA